MPATLASEIGAALASPDGSRLFVYSHRPAHVRVWDLRLLRRQLKDLGLDWDAPPFPPTENAADPATPWRVEVDLGDLAPKQRGRS